MNKKNINKPKGNVIVFLIIVIFSLGFIIFPCDVKAAGPSVSVSYLVTSDTTPLIKGTVSEAGADVAVVIIGHVSEIVTASGDGSWSYQLTAGEALAPGDYAVGVASVIGGTTYSDSAMIYIEEDYPLEFYYESESDNLIVSSITFSNEYTYTSVEEHFSLTFPAGTVITKTGGGTFNLEEWYAEGVDKKTSFWSTQCQFDFFQRCYHHF
ncbi:MAG: hypothetical protein NTZ97_00370 [Candidatus Moranbacteria bacterium]|nr:hypothetical protein [Candidatus Moranbacteria bacterium]